MKTIVKLSFTRRQLLLCGLLGVACIAALGVGIHYAHQGEGWTALKRFLNTSPGQNKGIIYSASSPSPSIKQTSATTPSLFEAWADNHEDNEIEATAVLPSPTELGKFDHAAVSADGQPCAQIATEVLRKNGSAADATIAGLFCVGVINTQSMGLGGGFLLTYYEHATGKAHALIARETAPGAAYEDMYHGDAGLMTKGGLAVAVPGDLRGYRALYERFGGIIPWADLIEPTIKLCEEGHLVNWHMARALKYNEEYILQEPSMSVFINPDTGTVYKEGDILKRPQLAKTLRIIQDDPDALYTGQLADKLAEDIQSFKGIITADDLRNYKPVWKDAVNVSIQHGNLTMYSVPPPGSGLMLGFILNILDGYGFTPDSMNDENIVLTHQRITEAFKWAYAKRTEMGDEDFVDMTGLSQNMTSDAYADDTRSKITDDRTFQDPGHYGAVAATEDDHGTAHFSLLAPNGDAVAVTSTVNLYFGALIRSTQTGIVLNDEMDDFSAPNITSFFDIPPSTANFIRAGKRPLSSMCPAVFVDGNGNVRLIVGAAGGTRISSAVAWVTIRKMWIGDNIKEAVDARRIHHQLYPMTFKYETGTLSEVVEGLEAIGHKTEMFGVGGSVVCAIAVENNGTIYANSDFRKAGEVDGF